MKKSHDHWEGIERHDAECLEKAAALLEVLNATTCDIAFSVDDSRCSAHSSKKNLNPPRVRDSIMVKDSNSPLVVTHVFSEPAEPVDKNAACDACTRRIIKMVEDKQAVAWMKLPSICGLTLSEEEWPAQAAQKPHESKAVDDESSSDSEED